MTTPSQDEIDAFLKLTDSRGGKRYWVNQKRAIMYRFFKDEIINRALSISKEKILQATVELGENPCLAFESRIRSFISVARKSLREKSESPDFERKPTSSSRKSTPSTSKSPEGKNQVPKLQQENVGSPVIIRKLASSSLKAARSTSENKKSKANADNLRKYWTIDKRRVIYKLFRDEMLNLDLQTSKEKVIQALDQLEEEPTQRNISRVRRFILRARKERKQKMDEGIPVTPLSSDSESGNEDTETNIDDGKRCASFDDEILLATKWIELDTLSSNVNSKDSGKISQDYPKSDQKELKVDSGNVNECESNNEEERTADPENVNETESNIKELIADSGNVNGIESNENEEYNAEQEESPIDLRINQNLFRIAIETYVKTGHMKNINEVESDLNASKEKTTMDSLVDESFKKTTGNLKNIDEREPDNGADESKLDPVVQSVDENDKDAENIMEDTSENIEDEALSLVIERKNDSERNERTLESSKEVTEIHHAEQSLDKNCINTENNDENTLRNDEEEMPLDLGVRSLKENNAIPGNESENVANPGEIDHQEGLNVNESENRTEETIDSSVRPFVENFVKSELMNEFPLNDDQEETNYEYTTFLNPETGVQSEIFNVFIVNDDADGTVIDPNTVQQYIESFTICGNNNNADTSNNGEPEMKYNFSAKNITNPELPQSPQQNSESKVNDVVIWKNGTEETCSHGTRTFDDGDTISEITSEIFHCPNQSVESRDGNENPLENCTGETNADPVTPPSKKKNARTNFAAKLKARVATKRKMACGDNNESSSFKRKKTQWTSEMTIVLKNHFAREISSSNWPTEAGKVDLITNILKTNGFDNITSELVFNWAKQQSSKPDNNFESISDQITGCLVAAVINGSIDLESIANSYP